MTDQPQKSNDNPLTPENSTDDSVEQKQVSEHTKTPKIRVHENQAFRKFIKAKTAWGTSSSEQETQTNEQNKSQKQSLLKKLTVGIVQAYQKCSDKFKYNRNMNPRRILTKPSSSSGLNNGYDNEEANLILAVNDVLNGRYLVKDLLGTGTFGQVARCEDLQSVGKHVAVKIIKNKPAYRRQAMIEIQILDQLMKVYDPEDKHHIVRMENHFTFRNHLCITFELLSINLYELIKSNRFQGLSTNLIGVFSRQVLDALCVLYKARIIHCDLKPENILLTDLASPKNLIKVIDFGSACRENQTMYSYIQSRFYRSPEVLFGLEYGTEIDMWSLGCICAELFLGLPLFPGVSEYNQVCRIVEMLGDPPVSMLAAGKQTLKYFKRVQVGNEVKYVLKTEQEYCRDTRTKPLGWKRYFNYKKLEPLIMNYIPSRKAFDVNDKKEQENRKAFIDFLKGILRWDPKDRWTPAQAIKHPFVTGEPFTGPYIPEEDPAKTEKEKPQHKVGIPIQRRQTTNIQGSWWGTPPHPSFQYGSYDGGLYTTLGPSPNTHMYTPPNSFSGLNPGSYGTSPHMNMMPTFGTPTGSFGTGFIGQLGPSPSSGSYLRQYQPSSYKQGSYKPREKRRSFKQNQEQQHNKGEKQRSRAKSWHPENTDIEKAQTRRHHSQFSKTPRRGGKPPKAPRRKRYSKNKSPRGENVNYESPTETDNWNPFFHETVIEEEEQPSSYNPYYYGQTQQGYSQSSYQQTEQSFSGSYQQSSPRWTTTMSQSFEHSPRFGIPTNIKISSSLSETYESNLQKKKEDEK